MNLLLQREWATAERLYRRVLRNDDRDFDAHHMLGVIALQTARPSLAVALLTKAVQLNPRSPQAQANLGSAQLCLQQADAAIQSYERALTLDPTFALAARNIGSGLQRLGRYEDAATSFERLYQLSPNDDYVRGDLFYSRRCAMDWRDFAAQVQQVEAGVAAGQLTDRPFPFLSVTASGMKQLQCARLQAALFICEPGQSPDWHKVGSHQRLKVAYVSADFRGHVVMNLMSGIFDHHDAKHFEILGINLTPSDGSAMAQRAKDCFDEFVDISAMSDADAVTLLRSKEVHIAVDLTGYTQGCRPGLFARRAAPLQVNFLGYPGTMGAEFMDYLIADDFVVPASNASMYTENIVRLPGTFQPTVAWSNGDEFPVVTRANAGLPDDRIVLCSFNNGFKVNPAVFEVWMRILAAAPDAVLWLLVEGQAAADRLRSEALDRGIADDRIIVAPRLPYRDHIARLALADLFLDTFPFNGGATANDALRAGVPILTHSGETFAARMAGSLLRAMNLHDLVTRGWDQYERLGIELSTDRPRLASLKIRLAMETRRMRADAGQYCRYLEAAYIEMRRRFEQGEAAADVTVRR